MLHAVPNRLDATAHPRHGLGFGGPVWLYALKHQPDVDVGKCNGKGIRQGIFPINEALHLR